MKATITSSILALFLFLGKASACDCLFIEDFCQFITFQNNGVINDNLHIYHVKVSAQTAGGMKVSILQTFHGEDLVGHQIFITGGNGADCQVVTSQFVVGEELIIAAGKFMDTWSMNDCGVSFLKVENGQVSGQIAGGVTSVLLSEFPALANCGDLTPTREPNPPVSVSLTPTLAHDEVRIQAQGFLTGDLELSIFDVTGRQVHRTSANGYQVLAGVIVPVGEWSAGVYFFRMKVEGRLETVKVVKAKND